jgi:hypothetical protein
MLICPFVIMLRKPEKVETAEDLLYKIPEHIKVHRYASKYPTT